MRRAALVLVLALLSACTLPPIVIVIGDPQGAVRCEDGEGARAGVIYRVRPWGWL